MDLSKAVLIVEDSESALELVTQLCQAIGFKHIRKSKEGQAALDLLNAAPPQGEPPIGLILADWNMPVMSGIDLLKSVRGLPAHKKTPFIMITADSEMDMIVQAISAGVSSYIVKPVTLEGLRNKIASVLK